jgi:hypothetical protein
VAEPTLQSDRRNLYLLLVRKGIIGRPKYVRLHGVGEELGHEWGKWLQRKSNVVAFSFDVLDGIHLRGFGKRLDRTDAVMLAQDSPIAILPALTPLPAMHVDGL